MSPSVPCACGRAYAACRVVAHSRLGCGWSCPLVRRLGIADRADSRCCGNFAARACIRHCLCPPRTERADSRQHNRLELLQRACRRRDERSDIAIQGCFAACFYAGFACNGAPNAFCRDLWIQFQAPSFSRHHHPSLRDHLARGIPRLSDSSHLARRQALCIGKKGLTLLSKRRRPQAVDQPDVLLRPRLQRVPPAAQVRGRLRPSRAAAALRPTVRQKPCDVAFWYNMQHGNDVDLEGSFDGRKGLTVVVS